MLGVFAFCMVLGTTLPSSGAISAEIIPSDELIVKKGNEINIQCILDLTPNSTQSAEDVLWYKDGTTLSDSLYTALNSSISKLNVVNVTFEDTGNYACGFAGDSTKPTLVVRVGLPPDKAENLICTAHTMSSFYCQWNDATLDTNLWNTDELVYKADCNTQDWQTCTPTSGENLCELDTSIENYFKRYCIRVKTSNGLGNVLTDDDYTFQPSTQTTPHPPQDLKVVPQQEGDRISLLVTWNNPEGLPYLSFNNRVYYRSQTTNGTQRKDVTSGFKWIVLDELTPYTEYTIEVTARSGIADPLNKELYWSEPAVTTSTTNHSVPFGNPSDVRIKTEFDSAKKHHRNVELVWNPVPDYQWGSPSISYEVTLIPQDKSPGHSLVSHTQSDSHTVATFHDLDKYQTYEVKVQPFNNHGTGDLSEFGNIIPDRTMEPSPPSNLNVSASSNTLLTISWGPPLSPNGLIYEYEVQVEGDAIFLSNDTGDQENTFLERTDSLAMAVDIQCKELTETGEIFQVWVSAATKNFTDHFFYSEKSTKMIHGACKETPVPEEFNAIFVGIFVPTTVIVSCIIALILWNCFKDTCVEPPDPQLSPSIFKNGQLKQPVPSPRQPLEKEFFDNPKPRVNPVSMTLDIEGSIQQTNLNPYHTSPRNEPKYPMERNYSHDSGVPDSPTEHVDIAEFSNSAFEEDETTAKKDVVPTVSRAISTDTQETDALSLRNSCFSEGSQDSCAEVLPSNQDTAGVSLCPSSLSSSTSHDPNLKLTLSPNTYGVKSPYSPHDLKVVGQSHEAETVGNYVRQGILEDGTHIIPNYVSTAPYMTMAPTSPPPITSGMPNGYVATASLPESSNGVAQSHQENLPSVEYSQMSTSGGYLQHDNMNQLSPPQPEGYIAHQSLSPDLTEYHDSYPNFDQNKFSDVKLNQQDNYIQHQSIPGSSGNGPSPNQVSQSTSHSSTASSMPYSKLSMIQ